jgi:hypothetical protein
VIAEEREASALKEDDQRTSTTLRLKSRVDVRSEDVPFGTCGPQE